MMISSYGVCWSWSDAEFEYMTSILTPPMLEIAHTYRINGIEMALEQLSEFMQNSNSADGSDASDV
jgi:hypothetical protein